MQFSITRLPNSENPHQAKFATVGLPKVIYTITFTHNLSKEIKGDDVDYLESKAITYIQLHANDQPIPSLIRMGDEFYQIRLITKNLT